MTQFLAVSNRKGGVGKSTIAVMLAHAAASWSKRRVLVMDPDTQCKPRAQSGRSLDTGTERGGVCK